MTIRLIITIIAVPGKGNELAAIYRERCKVALQEPGCEEFEAFQSVVDPDRLTVHERWKDQALFDQHLKVIAKRPPLAPGLRVGTEREDYEYNRTR